MTTEALPEEPRCLCCGKTVKEWEVADEYHWDHEDDMPAHRCPHCGEMSFADRTERLGCTMLVCLTVVFAIPLAWIAFQVRHVVHGSVAFPVALVLSAALAGGVWLFIQRVWKQKLTNKATS